MNPVLRNVLAVIVGCFLGGLVNIGLLYVGMAVVGFPDGVEFADPESLKANMHLMEFKHLIFPFLAHALGTLAGAIIAYKLGATHKSRLAYIVGAFFLLGGIMNIMNIGGPLAFNVLDLVVAYIPMAWLATKLVGE